MSETPQQQGWHAPAGGAEPPAFTPYQADSGEEFPPDSGQPEPFPGFPSDDGYVPAPAVVPIPGVQHELYPGADAAPPPPLSPIPDIPDSGANGLAGSWSAFAAGDAPKPAADEPSYEPSYPSYSESSSYSDSSSYSTPYPDSYSESPSYSDSPSYSEQPSYSESPSYSDSPSYSEQPSYSAPVADPPHDAGPVTGSVRVAASVPASSRLEPVDAPPPSPPSKPASGTVYGSASVPSASAVPASAPPVSPGHSYTPGYSDAPEYPPSSSSASSPVSPGQGGSGYGSAPVSPGQGGGGYGSAPVSPGAVRQPGAPVSPAHGADATGVVRATARVASLAQPMPGEAVPVSRTSAIYNSTAASAPAEAPPSGVTSAPPRQGRQHAFGDLLEPAAVPDGPPPFGGGYAQPGMQPPPPGMQSPPPGMQPPPPAAGFAPAAPAPAVPAQRAPQSPGQAAPDNSFASPPGRPPFSGQPVSNPEPKPERKGGLIVGVLVGCAALLALAFGGLFLLDKLVGPSFKVGDCVKQVGDTAEVASCNEAGVFKIESSVPSADQCDKTQPFLKDDDQFLCLKPADAP